MIISPEFEIKAKKKYEDMKSKGQNEAQFDESLGDIMLFINEEPLFCLATFEFDQDKIYIGSNESITMP